MNDSTVRDRLPWAILIAVLVLPAALALKQMVSGLDLRALRSNRAALDDYGVVPDFAFVEQSGKPIRRADLAGSPWIANFVYTRCDGICPLLSTAMAKLGRRVDGVRLVSFSVDPTRDTPAELTRYAERFAADPRRWLFLTGDAPAMRRLVSEGFHLAVFEESAGETGGAITHSDRIVLVDGDLHIRRYYSGENDRWIAEAVRDLGELRRSDSS
ncbi:MAG: SCO family protein [Candidatus Binatia bacterium]